MDKRDLEMWFVSQID